MKAFRPPISSEPSIVLVLPQADRERPAKAFSLDREADIIGRVSSRLP